METALNQCHLAGAKGLRRPLIELSALSGIEVVEVGSLCGCRPPQEIGIDECADMVGGRGRLVRPPRGVVSIISASMTNGSIIAQGMASNSVFDARCC